MSNGKFQLGAFLIRVAEAALIMGIGTAFALNGKEILSWCTSLLGWKKKGIADIHPKLKNIVLNSYEAKLLECIIRPERVNIDFDNIGGLAEQKNEIMYGLVYPMRHAIRPLDTSIPSSSIQVPPGFLFVGPPGTGKTLLARACSG